MIPELERLMNVTFPPAADLQSESARQFLDDLCVKNNIDCSAPRTSARMIDKMVGGQIANIFSQFYKVQQKKEGNYLLTIVLIPSCLEVSQNEPE